MDTPLVSIVIPCYNSQATLSETLDSVLKQSYDHFECILVDDGSSDDTFSIALAAAESDSRFHCYHQINKGVQNARNTAIKKSRGKYIFPLDSDDLIMPDFLAKSVAILEVEGKPGVVYGDIELFGNETGIRVQDEFHYRHMYKGNYIGSCALYSRHLWKKVGGYDHTGLEDWDFWLMLAEQGAVFYKISGCVIKYRVRSDSISRSWKEPQFREAVHYIRRKHKWQYEKFKYITAVKGFFRKFKF